MQCPKCNAAHPEAAHFCHVCGTDLLSTDTSRRRHFAVKPDEPVVSFSLVSTIMPRGSSERPQTYRVALLVVLTAALASAIFGALPIAVLLAAFSIPIVYIVYVYDVNLWEDEPVPVTLMAFLLTLVLGLGWTWAWLAMRDSAAPTIGMDLQPQFSLMGLVITAVLAPVVGEILRQIGPVFLASRPKYDDLMDGLTFGIISGVAYAAADTIVKQWPLITAGFVGPQDPGMWASLMFSEGFIKPLVIGTATGLACAEFSGLGEGYDGFSGRYFARVLEAMVYNVLYFGGVYLLTFLGNPLLSVLLSIAWGLILLAVLVVRVRTVLHTGLLEAALEHHARASGVGPEGRLEFCPACELPLLPDAAFCSACGVAARTASKAHPAAPVGAPAAPSIEEEEQK
jgi:hypothetical protein